MDNPLILWCGSVLNYKGLQHYTGEAPSATQWSKGLINGLTEVGVEVKAFAPIWDSYFPKGILFPGDEKYLDQDVNQQLVKYINLPFLRTNSVAYSLKRAILLELKKSTRPIIIITYNPYLHFCKAVSQVVEQYPSITWVNLVLDLDNPELDDWKMFKRNTRESKASIFLSWWGYSNAPVKNKLHLDSGWDGIFPKVSNSNKKKFIYAGKLAEYGGIGDIVEAIRHIKENDIEFHIYGKGYNKELANLGAQDARVKIHGFVTDEELDEACKSAFAFLSPRDLNYKGTKMIFPSKLFFYLKYRKPIISLHLPGLSPDYKDLLIQPLDNSPYSWAASMEEVITMSKFELENLAKRIELYIVKKTWKEQALSLINFIEKINSYDIDNLPAKKSF